MVAPASANRVLAIVVVVMTAGCSASNNAPRVADGAATAVAGRPLTVRVEALPGAPPPGESLATKLGQAVSTRGADYVPRTRHRRSDGSALYTNRLILETSPYLLQHAHNPVNWYPWGEEAFAEARRLGRPVLLSVGYSTCHWCHVMEEESFEDEEIATFINAHYIAIKVDREERPDVDSIYMTAVQIVGGRGGWPMTVWLTPDRKPFHAGTYIPPRDGDRGTATGFLTLLERFSSLYEAEPERVAEVAEQVTQRVRQSVGPREAAGELDPSAVEVAVRAWTSTFDPVNGGVGGAPKFPSSLPVRLLLRYHQRTGDPRALEMARLTLERMAAGGIHDQLGGGFHRYATDAAWLVPHFEKMLYDNALLAQAYLEAGQVTGDRTLSAVARGTLDYVAREMTAPGGGFYSATDADSLDPGGARVEGRFFTWTAAEIREALGPDEARLVEAYYGVTVPGVLDGRSILHVARPARDVASALGLDAPSFDERLLRARSTLYEVRKRRPPPARDDKILAAWNGLMISAMARAGFVLDEPAFVGHAARAAEFLLGDMVADGRLLRSHKDGRARHNAYLDDYAFVIAGLLDLYESSFEPRWLGSAIALQAQLDEHYRDEEHGGYFMTSDDHESLLVREKSTFDGAEPSGNSVALANLVRLAELTTDDRYRQTADRLVRAFSAPLRDRPTALAEMLLALEFRAAAPKEVALVAARSRTEVEPFLAVLRQNYFPAKVVSVVTERDRQSNEALVPWLDGKVAREGRPTAYVCENGTCSLPTDDAGIFLRQLRGGHQGPIFLEENRLP